MLRSKMRLWLCKSIKKSRSHQTIKQSTYLSRLHRTEADIGEEFGGRGRGQIHPRSINVVILFAQRVRIQDFENFIQTEFTQTL